MGMRSLPELSRDPKGINVSLFPPSDFISNLMKLPMMAAT